jgi:hypothetical protein
MKIVTVSQSSIINKYKNLNKRILKCCANIYFNKQCSNLDITVKFANIKTKNTSVGSKYTQQKIQKLRIKDDLKYPYTKEGN